MADYKKLIQKLLEAGGENSSKALTALKTGESKLPSFLRETEEAIVEDPRLVKQSTKRILPDVETTAVQLGDDLTLPPGAGSIADDVISSAAPKTGMSNLSKGLAIGAGGAGLGAIMMDGQDEEPLDTSVPATILKSANRQLPSGTKPDIKESTKKRAESTIQKAFEQSVEPATDLPPAAPSVDDFEARLAAARGQDVDRETLFGLLRAAQQGGAALANTKADTSFADTELANKNKFTNILGADEKLKKDRKEVTDEDVLRDPNSDISKQARDIAKKVGLKIGPNVTAQQLKTAGLPIGNLLTQQMAIDARKEQAALQREMIAATKMDKKELEREKIDMKQRDSVDKLVKNLQSSDDYKGYQAAKTAKVALENALVQKDKSAIGSAFMMYAKIAQGDNSVVRESDMKNLAGGMNYSSPSEMIAKLAAKAKGATFTDRELQQMKQIAGVIEATKAKHIKQQLAPIETRFKNYGLNPAESIDPSILREMEAADTSEPSAQGLTTISKPAVQSSAPVTIKSKKTGTVKTLSAEAAQRYLANPDFERVQ